MALDPPGWAPTPAEVAIRLMARTRAANGSIGAWTTETEPTKAQVEETIQQAMNFLIPRLGPVTEALEAQARTLAALRASYMVELSFYPEQSETSMSPYKALYAEYCEELKNWDEAATGDEPNSPAHIHSMRVGTDYPAYATGTY